MEDKKDKPIILIEKSTRAQDPGNRQLPATPQPATSQPKKSDKK
ncbi:MAG: hypothetical protein NT157_00050 [Candidatus Micrarchaeota archaeon]|nr:hypothetical protein [Candidatus Micrarchaeota archaeon]